jgi:uncharacterized protein (TIGR02996 family)
VIGDPIDPAPFLAAMPRAIRAQLERARDAKAGAIYAWSIARGRGWGQVGTTITMLRDATADPELTGWLGGIAMFGDDTDRLVDVLEGHPGARHALEAFAAGIAAGVAPLPGQWQRIERLTAFGHPPSLVAVVAQACASDDKAIRTVAQRLARKLGGRARDALEQAHKTSKGTSKRRLSTAALKVDERNAQLLRLLDGWRATRSTELASAIEILGLELGRLRGGALTAKTREALEEAWIELAKDRDPRDVDRLLATSWPKSLDHARKRVDLLRKFPTDPRILRGIATAATRHRSDSSLKFHESVAALFAETPIPELEHAIAAIFKAHDEGEVLEIYDTALAAARSVKPIAPHPSVLEDAARVLRARATLDALWATHCREPGDLAHRAVLADALQASDDPRGEFIALQLAELDAAAKKRVATLLAAHGDEWTGPIPLVSRSARRFERGFLVKLSCRAVGNELTATFDRPEWVTIEDLFIDGANCPLARVVKRMPLLRRLATPHSELLAQLARTGNYPQIEALACARGWLPPSDRFTNLRVMAAAWSGDKAIEDAQADARIRGLHAIVHLGVDVDTARIILEHVKRGPAETRIAIGGDFHGFDTDGWRIRVIRDRGVAELAWGGGSAALKDLRRDLDLELARSGLDVTLVKRIDLGA